MDFIIHIIYFIVKHYVFYLVVSVLVLIFCASKYNKFIPRKKSIYYILLFNVIFACIVPVFGTMFTSWLMYNFGEQGTGQITGSYSTGAVYNNKYVNGYRVIINTKDGKQIETSFETDNFNVYPISNLAAYPIGGQTFTVHYLRQFPKDFVIVNNNNNP